MLSEAAAVVAVSLFLLIVAEFSCLCEGGASLLLDRTDYYYLNQYFRTEICPENSPLWVCQNTTFQGCNIDPVSPPYNQNQQNVLQTQIDHYCANYLTAARYESFVVDRWGAPQENVTQTNNASMHDAAKCDITLVSVLSIARLHKLELVAQYWNGPAQFAYYSLNESELSALQLLLQNSSILRARQSLYTYRLVRPRDNVNITDNAERSIFPLNLLRNIALENISTPFTLMMDIDYVFPYGEHTYDVLRAKLLELNICDVDKTEKTAYVIPAFQAQHATWQEAYANLPANKAELTKIWHDRDGVHNNYEKYSSLIIPFAFDVSLPVSLPVDYLRWRNATEPYEVKFSAEFEPFFITRTELLPKYDTRFSWPSYDRVEHLVEMAARRFKFLVLNDIFTVHLPHSTRNYRLPPEDFLCRRVLLANQFLDELKRNPVTFDAAQVALAVNFCYLTSRKDYGMCFCY